jgi:uncharacterized membrane protein (UPF0127 family)
MTYTPTNTIKAIFQLSGKTASLELEAAGFMKSRGLMHRKSLDPDRGMLFEFSRDNHWEFWMLNTYIPLDIIFIDKNKQVVAIEEGVPLSDRVIKASVRSRYVIETNRGWAKANGITVGTKVYF